ncbi:MAG: hypothetical protein IIV50_03485 [Muribaculaceae bacterium]|nr:hypothetical protein [Muribaculaceae bacterium]
MKKILLLIVVLFGLMFFREFAMSNEIDNSHGYAYENDTIDNNTNLFPTDYFNSDYPWNQGWVSMNDANANKNLNKGEVATLACGYDATGVWRTIAMRVAYSSNGILYKSIVLSAWNPWTDEWERNINVPAVNTDIDIKGTTFKFYVVLSTGTYYFNL